MRREAPVFWYEREDIAPFWAITRHADVLTISKRADVFVNSRRLRLASLEDDERQVRSTRSRVVEHDWDPDEVPDFIFMDDPRHRHFRLITAKRFTPAWLNKLEAHFRELSERFAQEFAAELTRAADSGETVDFVRGFAQKLPLSAIGEMMGLPPDDWMRLKQLTNVMIGAPEPDFFHPGETRNQGVQRAVEEMTAYMIEVVRDRRERGSEVVRPVQPDRARQGRRPAAHGPAAPGLSVRDPGGGQRDHPERPHRGRPRAARTPRAARAAVHEPGSGRLGLRGDPALDLARTAVRPHGGRGLRTLGREDRRRTGRRLVVPVGEPGSRGLRGTLPLRHHPRPQPAPGLRRLRRALLSGGESGPLGTPCRAAGADPRPAALRVRRPARARTEPARRRPSTACRCGRPEPAAGAIRPRPREDLSRRRVARSNRCWSASWDRRRWRSGRRRPARRPAPARSPRSSRCL